MGSATGSPALQALTVAPSRAELGWRSNALRHVSDWTLQEQRFRRFGQWGMRLEWTLLPRREYGLLMAVLNRYVDEPFTVYDPTRDQPAEMESGARLIADYDNLAVAGANQAGRTLAVDGAPNSTLLFRAGDLVGIATTGEVYELTADATSNGSGQLSLSLNQYIRTPPGDTAQVLVKYVPIRMWLQAPVTAQVQDGPPYWNVTAEMLEAL